MSFPPPISGGGGGGNVSTPLPASDPGTAGTLWSNGGFVIVSQSTASLALQAGKYQDVTLAAGAESIAGLVLTTGTKSNGISLTPGTGAPGYGQNILLQAGKAFDTYSPAGNVTIAAGVSGGSGGLLYVLNLPTSKGAKGSAYLDTVTNGIKLSP